MAYEVIILYHLHMPRYFVGTFTEYPFLWDSINRSWMPRIPYYQRFVPSVA